MKITRTICTPSTDITVEIKLLPSEVEAAYREQEETFRLLDAERQLCEYLQTVIHDVLNELCVPVLPAETNA